MKLIPGLAWLVSFRRKRLRHPVEPDHGDMGTAFGLDAIQSLFQEPAVEPGSAGAPEKPRPWEHRLTRRTSL